MPKYLFHASYTEEGLKGLLQEGGSSRRNAVEQTIKGLGGTLEAFYYAFGDTDVYAVCDFPDDASAAAVSLLINAAGAVQVSLTPLLAVEDIDAAAQKTPSYRPPGS